MRTFIEVLIEEEKFQEAVAEVRELQERKLNGYERAHVLNMAGFLYFQLEDTGKALASYKEALQQEGLPDSQIRGLLNSVAQVSLAESGLGCGDRARCGHRCAVLPGD